MSALILGVIVAVTFLMYQKIIKLILNHEKKYR